jgi:hypothetical protein
MKEKIKSGEGKLALLMIAFMVIVSSIAYILEPCKTFESHCYDYTWATWDSSIELDGSICQDHTRCNEYCKRTYSTQAKMSTCCWTDGEVPDTSGHCVNIQMCQCEKPEKAPCDYEDYYLNYKNCSPFYRGLS